MMVGFSKIIRLLLKPKQQKIENLYEGLSANNSKI